MVSCLLQHICSCQHPCPQKRKSQRTLSPPPLVICMLRARVGFVLVPALMKQETFAVSAIAGVPMFQPSTEEQHKQHHLLVEVSRGWLAMDIREQVNRKSCSRLTSHMGQTAAIAHICTQANDKHGLQSHCHVVTPKTKRMHHT